ncbi:MAG TPA: stage II sporulation protein P [Sphingobacteriaceae bacterium]|nr:stage II sporulation protein P [Sphingobacteriaceae bacterium]
MGTGRRSFAWYRAWPFLLLWAIAALGMALMFLPPAGGLEPAVPAAASAGRPGPGTRLLRHILRTAIPVLQWVDPPPSLTDPQGLNPGRLLRLFMEAGGGMSLGRPWTLLAAELPGLGTMAPPPASHASGGQPPLIPLVQDGWNTRNTPESPAEPPDGGEARDWPPAAGGPVVLIYHTHGSEAFLGGPAATAGGDPAGHGFSPDPARNMIRVGRELASVLQEQHGVPVIHVTDLFDWQNNAVTRIGAYYRSLQMLENFGGTGRRVTDVHPSLMLILDLHRDAVPRSVSLATVGDQPMAKVLFVVGTRSQDHPNWRQNLCVAETLNHLVEESYPGLSRGVRRHRERFNQHLMPGALLIEIGSVENTLEEALATARILAHVIDAAGRRGLLPRPGVPYECPAGPVSQASSAAVAAASPWAVSLF